MISKRPTMASPKEVPIYSIISLTRREPNGALPRNTKVYRPMILPRYSGGDAIWIAVLQFTMKRMVAKPSRANMKSAGIVQKL